jgi:hypothetical protein
MNNRRGAVPILLVVLVALVAAGGVGYFAFMNTDAEPAFAPMRPEGAVSRPPIVGNPFPPIVSSTPTDNAALWKAYRNTEYGFEFQYPSGWMFENDIASGTIIVKATSFSPTLRVQLLNEPYANVVAQKAERNSVLVGQGLMDRLALHEKSISFSGVVGKEFLYDSPVGQTDQTIILPSGLRTIVISSIKGTNLDGVLATLKFIPR